MVVGFTNHGPDDASSIPISLGASSYLDPPYALDLGAQPGCGTLLPGDKYGYHGYRFYVGPVATGQTILCTIHVTRLKEAIDSVAYGFEVFNFPADPSPNNNWTDFFLGTFTDVAMSSQQITFSLDQHGIAHSVLRLRAENRGPADVGALRVTACTDNFYPQFYIESDFPGGCGPDVGALCFDSGFGFQLPPLAAGRNESCDLKLTSLQPYTGRLDFEFMRIEGSMLPDPVTGGTLIDTNGEDDWVDLYQVAPPPQPVPAEWPITHLLVALSIMVLGSLALRRNHPA